MVELIQMNGILQAHSINKKKERDMLTNLYIQLIFPRKDKFEVGEFFTISMVFHILNER